MTSALYKATGNIDGSGTPDINASIDVFQQQNMSPSETFSLGNSLPQTIGGIPGIGSRIPGLGKIPLPFLDKIPEVLAPLNSARFGVSGAYESGHYADDLVDHHPKFKFLFKVKFYGFPGGDEFFFYVNRCDKPKVKFNHQDVNYYNFRTRVLTSVTYDPLMIQFLDEVGNSIVDFFQAYMFQTSGAGSGNYGIADGFGAASSSYNYAAGYTGSRGQKIVLEQIFVDPKKGVGPRSNRFTFINPRIETFDFDELSHEESNTGSMATLTFSYDAIYTETVAYDTLYSWGNTDLFKGGGSSGVQNAGNLDGNLMFTDGKGQVKKPKKSLYDALAKGSDMILRSPTALAGVLGNAIAPVNGAISSVTDSIGAGISGTLDSISSGANSIFGGKPPPGDAAVPKVAQPSTVKL